MRQKLGGKRLSALGWLITVLQTGFLANSFLNDADCPFKYSYLGRKYS